MADTHEQFWTMIKKFRTCMVTTIDGGLLRSRPLAPLTLGHNKAIYFLVARDSHKIEEIEKFPQLNLSFASDGKNEYVSVSGDASFSDDIALKKELWSEMADIWFDHGPEDPNAIVLIVEPTAAEYWDGTRNIAKMVWEFAKAKLTNLKPDLGKNRKLSFG
ncbi:MAG: pyridoxamine 5'-phosphate oxidase family protein [Pseudomonadota bacterium]